MKDAPEQHINQYTASQTPLRDYVPLAIQHYTVYVPKPDKNTNIDPRLVRSVLEVIAKQCAPNAIVRNNCIMEQTKGGRGRHRAVVGSPNEKDVKNALVRAGYKLPKTS